MTPSTASPHEVDVDLFDDEDFEVSLLLDDTQLDDTPFEDESDPVDEGKKFLDTCEECERVCFETAEHCLSQGGSLSDVRGIQLLRNCARVCRTSAASWSVGSRLYSQVLRAAARLCGECATVCDGLASDRQLKTCAEVCRACGKACERMSVQPLEVRPSVPQTV
jgi:hypothetical protein